MDDRPILVFLFNSIFLELLELGGWVPQNRISGKMGHFLKLDVTK